MKNKNLKFTLALGLSVILIVLSFSTDSAYRQLFSALAIFMSAYTMGLTVGEAPNFAKSETSVNERENSELQPEGTYKNEAARHEKRAELQEAV